MSVAQAQEISSRRAESLSKIDPLEAARWQQWEAIEAKATNPAELIAAKEAFAASLPSVPPLEVSSTEAKAKMMEFARKIAAQPGPDGQRARLAFEVSDTLNGIRQAASPAEVIVQTEQFGSLNAEILAELAAPIASMDRRPRPALSTNSPYFEVQTVLEEIRGLSDPAEVIGQLEEFQRLNAEALVELAAFPTLDPSNPQQNPHP